MTAMDTPTNAPVISGKPFRWLQPDGSIGYDLPELTRRVRNAWPSTVDTADLGKDWGDDENGRMLTVAEWESVCAILDLLPAVYQQRDQARRMAMQLEEELALLRGGVA